MKTVKINGLRWKVFFVKNGSPKLTDEDGKRNILGITYFRECEIYIDKELHKRLRKQTVIHELVHALLFSYGINAEGATEEEICDLIGAHLDELVKLKEAI